MKKRLKAFISVIGVIIVMAFLFSYLEESKIVCAIFQSVKAVKGFFFVWFVFFVALVIFAYHLGRWIWQADHINRKSQHVKLLGSIMFLLWTIGWLLFIRAFMCYSPCHQFVNAELFLRSAIASLNLFMLDIDSNILDEIKQYPRLKGAISFVSILSFLCTVGLLLSLVSERLMAYIRLLFTCVKRDSPHVYVFFGLNEEAKILAKDIMKNDAGSVRIVVEQNGKEQEDDKGGWNHVVNMITHRGETFQKVKEIGAKLSLTSVDLSEMDINQKNVFAEANLGLVRKKICRLARMTTDRERKLHLFFLSDNEEKNILSTAIIREDETIRKISEDEKNGVKVFIYCHARYDSVNRVIEESSPKKNVEIRIIDSSRLSIELLKRNIENHPVKYVEIDGQNNPGTVKSEFNSLVVGLGETGRDAVRFLYEYGAFMSNDSDNEKVERSLFHCYVVDRDMDGKEGLLTNSASEAVKAKNRDETKLLQFVHADSNSTAFFELLHRIAKSLNYVVVAMGTDIENMTLAVRILKCLMANGNDRKRLRILVRVRNNAHVGHFRKIANHYNQSIGITCLDVFGAYDDIFSYSLVVEDQFKEDAKQFYNRYQEIMQEKEPALQSGTWEERRDELLGLRKKVVSKIPTDVAMKRYLEGKPINEKMLPTDLCLGFEYVDEERIGYPKYKNLRKLRRQTEQDMSNAWHKLTKRELMEKSIHQDFSFGELHDKIKQLETIKDGTEYRRKYDQLDENISKLILNLAITEHLRWNASHEMLGYKKGDKTDELLQLHNCLVNWNELDKVSKNACEEAKEAVEKGEYWDFDFSKEIKKQYPHYNEKVKAYVLYLPDYKKYDFAVVETTIALLKKDEERNKKTD